jgi:tellurite resistance protein
MRVKVPVVPASFFGMVIGLAGLGAAWRWAHQVWGLPAVVGEAIIWLSIAVWAGLTILYIAKWFVARDDARAEVEDPVQCCFVGLIGVATMLVAAGIQPYSPALAVILFAAGAAFALGFAVWRTGALWRGEREHAATTAVLYLPTVTGSFVTAIAAAALGYADWTGTGSISISYPARSPAKQCGRSSCLRRSPRPPRSIIRSKANSTL